jgi:hypothetical protein
VGALTSSTNPIITALSTADLSTVDSCYDFDIQSSPYVPVTTYYTVTSTVVSDHSVHTTGITTTPATDYISSMVNTDLLDLAVPFYIMPNSQENSDATGDPCQHRNAYINSSYSATYTHNLTEGQIDWDMEFEQQQGVPFNVTVLYHDNSTAFNPGSWFVLDYANFDINQTMKISWKLQEIPTFYELSVLYQIKIKVRLYH